MKETDNEKMFKMKMSEFNGERKEIESARKKNIVRERVCKINRYIDHVKLK